MTPKQLLRIRQLVVVILVSLPLGALFGQGTKSDYQRMAELGRLTSGKVFRVDVSPHWLPEGHHLWYRVKTGKQTHEFVFVDLQKQVRALAFDHERVAEQLAAATGETIAPDKLPFKTVQFSPDLAAVFFRHGRVAWKINREDSTLSKAADAAAPKAITSNLTAVRPSQDKGEEMELEFVNNTSEAIRTIWIDRRGQRVPYKTIGKGERARQHTFVGHVWLVLNPSDEVLALFEAREGESTILIDGKTKLKLQSGPPRSRAPRSKSTSPDGNFRAEATGDQFAIIDIRTDQQIVVVGVQEDDGFFDERRFYWAPDSRFVVALQVQPGEARKVHTVESSPADQLQPKLHELTYAKPGDRIRTERPRMFDVQEKKEVELDDALFTNPWSLRDFRWRADSSEFSFLFNARGHQAMRLIGINPSTSDVRAIIDESSKTFIDYTNKVFYRDLEDQGTVIWMSERDGWNHLYQYNWREGKVQKQITQGEWVVRGVDRVDAEKRQIWFRASGLKPGEDPYFIHHCRVDFDGSNLVTLTEGNGTHTIAYSPNHEYLLDTYSRVDQPNVTDARRVSDGSLVCHLERGDCTSLLDTGWQPTMPFAAKGRDGMTDIYGVIYVPTNFDPSNERQFPVIEYIYAGPHDSFVPKRFATHNQARTMAELGFIVVQIDGMGTNNRGKAFHDVCWKNLGDSGFPDRIAWLKAAANKVPQMDLSRVGIYGGSAGGQSALRALLAHGEFYKAAVADCGCHDNRMDKIWWNEQWMGWPVGPHYDEQSNVTNAHQLQGKLLLIVGELDRNVDPASTMQVVNALVKADKDFDFLLVPGAGHGIGSGKYGMRRTRDFFVRHLHGAEPRRD